MKAILGMMVAAIGVTGLPARAAIVTVEPLGLTGQKPSPPALAVFGGITTTMEVAIEAPLGSRVSISYDLLQVAGGLVAAIEKNRSLAAGVLDFGQRTRQVVSVEVAVPSVQRPARMLVAFSANVEGSTAPAGRVQLHVYPRNEPGALAKGLAAAAEQGGMRLGLFGESPLLRAFFQEQEIAFEDFGIELPSRWEKDTLYLGESSSAKWEERPGRTLNAKVVVFLVDAMEPSGVFRILTPTSSITKVTLPILQNLALNPQNQHLLIDILQNELNPTATPVPSS